MSRLKSSTKSMLHSSSKSKLLKAVPGKRKSTADSIRRLRKLSPPIARDLHRGYQKY